MKCPARAHTHHYHFCQVWGRTQMMATHRRYQNTHTLKQTVLKQKKEMTNEHFNLFFFQLRLIYNNFIALAMVMIRMSSTMFNRYRNDRKSTPPIQTIKILSSHRHRLTLCPILMANRRHIHLRPLCCAMTKMRYIYSYLYDFDRR